MRLVQVIFGEEGEVSRRINWGASLSNATHLVPATKLSSWDKSQFAQLCAAWLAAAANKKQFAAENAISLLPSHNHQCWHQLSTLHCNNIELLKMLLRKKN